MPLCETEIFIDNKNPRIGGAAIALIAVLLAAAPLGATEIAVIVHPDNALEDISFGELSKIFKAEKQFWGSGERIYFLLRESGSKEKEIILQKLYGMSETDLKKFWLTKLFREEIPSFPKTIQSNEAVKRFVSRVPNAIGFIDAASADNTVKILTIDGVSAGSENYPLTDRPK